jgi:hypothetical protein
MVRLAMCCFMAGRRSARPIQVLTERPSHPSATAAYGIYAWQEDTAESLVDGMALI